MNIENRWQFRGDNTAQADIRAGHVGPWDEGAVLDHLGIASEDDVDAVAYGLKGEDLATAQRAALAGYARAMADLAAIVGSITTATALEDHGRRRLHSMPNRDAEPACSIYASRLMQIVGYMSQDECEARAAQWMREGIRR